MENIRTAGLTKGAAKPWDKPRIQGLTARRAPDCAFVKIRKPLTHSQRIGHTKQADKAAGDTCEGGGGINNCNSCATRAQHGNTPINSTAARSC